MSDVCYRCGKPVTLSGHVNQLDGCYENVAPDAASGGTMSPVHWRCSLVLKVGDKVIDDKRLEFSERSASGFEMKPINAAGQEASPVREGREVGNVEADGRGGVEKSGPLGDERKPKRGETMQDECNVLLAGHALATKRAESAERRIAELEGKNAIRAANCILNEDMPCERLKDANSRITELQPQVGERLEYPNLRTKIAELQAALGEALDRIYLLADRPEDFQLVVELRKLREGK